MSADFAEKTINELTTSSSINKYGNSFPQGIPVSSMKRATFRGDQKNSHKMSLFSLKSWSLQNVAPVWSPQDVVLRHFKGTLPK
jgi:hypothetical protein